MDDSKVIQIFIAYSRKDSEFLIELKTFLFPLERNQSIKIWYDGEIVPGQIWENEIKQALHSADIFLLLVSANSLASNYFYDKEVSNALERHRKGESIVIPIILKPCGWSETDLALLQALPKNGKPVTSWTDKDEAYQSIFDGLKSAINKIQQNKREKEKKLEGKATKLVEKKSNDFAKQQHIVTTGTKSNLLEFDSAKLSNIDNGKKKNNSTFKYFLIIGGVIAIIVILFLLTNNPGDRKEKAVGENEVIIAIEDSTQSITASDEESGMINITSKIYSQGKLTIKGSYTYDLDLGSVSDNSESNKVEFHYEFVTEHERYFSPWNGVFYFLGQRDFNSITATDLANFPYSRDKINASDNSGNKLTVGTVVAVKTNEGRYSKFIIDAYGTGQWGQDIEISYITYERDKKK